MQIDSMPSKTCGIGEIMKPKTQQSRQRNQRRGSIYVPVMASALIVSVIGLSAMTIARTQLRSSSKSNDSNEAEVLALSAIENAMTAINSDNIWRTKYVNNVETTPLALGNGTISWKFEDPDGDLTNDPLDTTYLYGIGRAGDATYVNKVQLETTGAGLTCLEVALHAGGNIGFAETTLVGNSPISANANIAAVSSTLYPPMEAVGIIGGGTYYGSKSMGIRPRQMPGSSMFDYYLNHGSRILIGSLPKDSGSYRLRNTVLSPNSNPFAVESFTPQTNSEGIYIIDCKGQELRIENCRIVGTLVILNPGTGTRVRKSVNWEPAVRNYPVLLVKGSIRIELSYNALDEAVLMTNFNPTGTPAPYNGGATDADTSDMYTSRIKGLVAVTEILTLDKETRIHGVILADTVGVGTGSVMNFIYNPQYLTNPPPGFADDSEYKISPGSWERVSY